MTDLRTAAQQALEALEEATNYTGCEAWSPSMTDECRAIAATLRAALKQPEQEPVAMSIEALANSLVMSRIVHPDAVDDSLGYDDGVTMDRMQTLYRMIKGSLYTHPPRREWQSLTDDEIKDAGRLNVEGPRMLPYSFARAIEAALKERNT